MTSQRPAPSTSDLYHKLYNTLNAPPSTIGGYEIVKQIGEGAFGTVYVAIHSLTRIRVVLKKGSKQDPNVVREIIFHRQMSHANIAQLYEVIVTENSVYLALEYCSKGELYEHFVSKKCDLGRPEVCRLFSQIAGAVCYMHSLQVAHRDLKLENVLLDKRLDCKLLDFGFARDCFKGSSLRTVCGTHVYMAPELIAGEPYNGFRIDVWALGVILYTLVYGEMPFEEDEEVLKDRIQNDTPEKLRNVDLDLCTEEQLRTDPKYLLSQLLEKRPQKRLSVEGILKHPFLQPYGQKALAYTKSQLSFTKNFATRQFQSHFEKHLLKHLSRLGFDSRRIRESVVERKCDQTHAMWYLLLQKENRRVKLKERWKASKLKEKVNESPEGQPDISNQSLLVSEVQTKEKQIATSSPLKELFSEKKEDLPDGKTSPITERSKSSLNPTESSISFRLRRPSTTLMALTLSTKSRKLSAFIDKLRLLVHRPKQGSLESNDEPDPAPVTPASPNLTVDVARANSRPRRARPILGVSTCLGFSQALDLLLFAGTVLSMDTPRKYARSKSLERHSPSASEQSLRKSSFYDYATSNGRGGSPDVDREAFRRRSPVATRGRYGGGYKGSVLGFKPFKKKQEMIQEEVEE